MIASTFRIIACYMTIDLSNGLGLSDLGSIYSLVRVRNESSCIGCETYYFYLGFSGSG